jgi:hypothetical protein
MEDSSEVRSHSSAGTTHSTNLLHARSSQTSTGLFAPTSMLCIRRTWGPDYGLELLLDLLKAGLMAGEVVM